MGLGYSHLTLSQVLIPVPYYAKSNQLFQAFGLLGTDRQQRQHGQNEQKREEMFRAATQLTEQLECVPCATD